MDKISKESREILNKWKDISDSVGMGALFEFAEYHGLTQGDVYEFFDIDYEKLEKARDELVRSL